MSGVIIAGDTSGSVTLQAPAVSGSTVLTLPAQTGTVMVNGPAFSAYQSSGQSILNNTQTKVQFQTEEFDTNSNYDTTNYRFTPTVAGYYQINSVVTVGAVGAYFSQVAIYKNGSSFKQGALINANGSAYPSATVNALIYFNGSTDYVEAYIFQFSGSSATLAATAVTTYFQAFLARSA